MKIRRVLVFAVFMLVSVAASGQFTISTIPSGNISPRDLRDSIAPNPLAAATSYRNDFFDRDFWKAEKRRIRRVRHTTEVNASLQVSQTQFKNWAGGGDNTFNGITSLYIKHSHKREKLYYEGSFDGRYGMNFIDKTRFKNIDEFKVNLQISWDINQWWSYAASSTLRSQIATGYVSRDDRRRRSSFMAPGFLNLEIGFKYHNSPLTVLVTPVGGNATFILDEKLRNEGFDGNGLNGVDLGDKAKWEVGPSLKINVDYKFYKDIFWLRSELYSFTNTKKAPIARWETNMEIKATKFLSTTFKAILYYNKESNAEKPRSLQYNSTISVGLAYSFRSKQ